MSQTIQLNLSLVLPEIDAGDDCVCHLIDRLAANQGIEQAHIVREDGDDRLCLHYDPASIAPSQVQHLASEAGTAICRRYRHEQIPFLGLSAADAADTLTQTLAKMPGVLHANANYAAGLIFIAYDSQLLQRPAIEQAIRRMGARLPQPAPAAEHAEHDHHHGHDHGSAPTFLPHWMQERWTLLLVGSGWPVPADRLGRRELPGAVAGRGAGLLHPGLYRRRLRHRHARHPRPAARQVRYRRADAGGGGRRGDPGRVGRGRVPAVSVQPGPRRRALCPRPRPQRRQRPGRADARDGAVKRGDAIVELPVGEVLVGDLVVVRPGDRVPVDGSVAGGHSAIDQSPITGESVPVRKQPGDQVFAGTINQDGALDISVTRLAQDNTLSRVMRLVAEAQSQQSPTQQFTQRFTAWFVPAVLVACVLFIAVPPLAGWMLLTESFYRAMLLLVAASPCALALGTPATVLAGIAQAARNGVLIKGGVHLENLGAIDAMAFDKTGTLTEGRFSVTDVLPLGGASADELLRVAAAVEQQSSHPLAQAVVGAAQAKRLSLPIAAQVENIPGRGMRALVDGQPVLLGSLKLFREAAGHALDDAAVQAVEQLERSGRSTVAISQGGRFLGVLGLADAPRAGVQQTMQRLRSQGIRHLVMLTGDNADVAQRIAKRGGRHRCARRAAARGQAGGDQAAASPVWPDRHDRRRRERRTGAGHGGCGHRHGRRGHGCGAGDRRRGADGR